MASGSATCVTGILPAGDYNLTATYSGDSNYAPSTGTASFAVTTTQIGASTTQSLYDAGSASAWGSVPETTGATAYDSALVFANGNPSTPPSGQVTYLLYDTINCSGSAVTREVLLDHDHRQDLVDSVGVVGMLVAAQERIGGQVGVERGLELGLQVTAGDPAQDLPVRLRQSRVTGPTAAAALLEQILANTHARHHGAAL